MSAIKKLAGDTAIYGIPSIVGRLINFLLVFFFAKYFTPAFLAPYIEFYAYIAFFFVVLPHGMETAFFNFARITENHKRLFGTAFVSVACAAILFLIVLFIGRTSAAEFAGHPNNVRYVLWFGLIVAIDVLISIPFALLRYLNKARQFATIKSAGILLNVVLNVFFVVWYPELTQSERNIEYIFISNLIASAAMFLMLLPMVFKHFGSFEKEVWKKMFRYSWPLILLGLAGIINETFDRVALRKLLPANEADFEIGIYGTFYRLSMIMTIFIQAFRYAAEPYFFSQSKQADVKEMYAKVMNYFVLVCGFIFLITSLFKSEIAHLFIRNEAYFDHPDALTIIPILLMANLFVGVFYNLSIWYKINDKTKMGATIVSMGAILTIALLFVFVPKFGFVAAAYTTLIVYVFIVVLSYLLGRRYYPVPYAVGRILMLISGAVLLYCLSTQIQLSTSLTWAVNGLLLLVYTGLGYILIIRPRNI